MRGESVPSKLVDPASLPTWTFDWGVIKPLVATDNTEAGQMSMLHVILLPGKGHDRHNHPESDEILYIVAGEGDQMVDDGEPFPVRPGQTVFIPKGAFHSTLNTGYEPMVILAVYAPAGAEDVLKTLPDYVEVPAGEAPALERR
jgi:oxalate decarboxylase/phosphoglucose isomerase-like protein (cupin superfamily)